MRLLRTAAIVALSGAAARLAAQPPGDTAPARPDAGLRVTPRVRALAGCYRLTVGPWRDAPPGGPDLPSQRPPGAFRLDTLPTPPSFGDRFAVEPAHTSGYGRWPAGWTVVGDTVALGWSTGFTGVQLRLVARGDTLAGGAETFQDARVAGRRDPEAPARAVRTRCPGGRHRV